NYDMWFHIKRILKMKPIIRVTNIKIGMPFLIVFVFLVASILKEKISRWHVITPKSITGSIVMQITWVGTRIHNASSANPQGFAFGFTLHEVLTHFFLIAICIPRNIAAAIINF
ncbi:hypothetical protein ACJX0J_035793, partial [Zea mays]